MSTPELQALLEQAIAHVNAGELAEGRSLLERVLEKDPQNDRAWVWLSGCVEDTMQRRICLQQALKANPNNQAALDGMQVLEGNLVRASQVPPSLLESRLSAIGMGNRAAAPAEPTSPAEPAPAPEMAPPAPSQPAPGAPAEFAEETETGEAGQRPRSRRLILLVAALLLLMLVVCILVGTQVVPVLLDMLP